ncbi:MAG: hypothetical protein KF760_14835 [Candidatus Eremiobacteraeota bacterium]|nr:hypothetical protein [Candidatus Eremiobacteraeota bacterium]MCW5869828.1 hypothetical protein [Candidatus Eremiobacteraeota bacterium]
MNSLQGLNSPGVAFTSLRLDAPVWGAAGARLAGLPGVGAFEPRQLLLQQPALGNQALLQLMGLVLGLMTGNSAASSSSSPATPGMPAGTDTGRRLAEFARAEATDGDSQGGWCYRDVGRALRKIGIETSGASAYMAADQLAKNPKVREVKVPASELAKLPAGAIVVWDRGNGNEHGHISIATGDGQEASDIMRKQATTHGTSHRVFMPI